MAFKRIIAAFALVVAILRTGEAVPLPDSAGMVPLPPGGLAYGGIPYGSVSGSLGHYAPSSPPQRQAYYPHNGVQESALVAADTRTIPVVSPVGY